MGVKIWILSSFYIIFLHSGYSGQITDDRVKKFLDEVKEKATAKLQEAKTTRVK